MDRCCRVGRERAIESAKFNCKLSAREALIVGQPARSLIVLSAEAMLSREPSFADQCEMVLESCCMGHHRSKNCDSGKQLAKSGASCMDVELSKETSVATESFNDCCMSCSLGILAGRNPGQNETSSSSSSRQPNLAARCKLISPLAASLSGQLYEQTYIECCRENLPKLSSALVEPGELQMARLKRTFSSHYWPQTNLLTLFLDDQMPQLIASNPIHVRSAACKPQIVSTLPLGAVLRPTGAIVLTATSSLQMGSPVLMSTNASLICIPATNYPRCATIHAAVSGV